MTVREDTTFREWVRQIVASVREDDRRDLAHDPKGAVVRRFGLQLRVTAAPQVRGDGGWCDGMSFSQGNLVLYKESPYSKRENFTIMHELAHFLVRQYKSFAVWVADRPDTKPHIEEVCNAVAAELLLPTAFVVGVLDGKKPRARHLLTLVQRSEASREVCAIAIAPHLGCYGFAAIVSLNQAKIAFASRVPDTRPYPRRDDALPPGHPLLRLGPTRPVTATGWWPYPDGQPEQYYVDAVAEGHFGYALCAVDDLWGATDLHVSRSGADPCVRWAIPVRMFLRASGRDPRIPVW